MKRLHRFTAAATLGLALTIAFSPLCAAFFGTGLDAQTMAAAFRGIASPLGGSLGIAWVAAMVSLLMGVPFALLVERSRPAVRRLCWMLGLVVLMAPPYIVAEAWIVLFGPAGKISKPVAMFLGFGPHSTSAIDIARYAVPGYVYTWPMVGAIMGGCLFPIVALAVASALRRTDYRVFESARMIQGPRGVAEIAVRLLSPPAIGAALLVFAVTLTEFAVPQLLRVRTIGEAIYEQIQEGDLASAAAISLPLLPLVVMAAATGAWVLARSRVASMAGLEGEIPRYNGRPAGAIGQVAAGIVTLFDIGPALLVPITSLTWLALAAAIPRASEIGTHKVLRASGFADSLRGAWSLAHDDAVRTILLASFTATLATAFAMLLARVASRVGWGAFLGTLAAGLAVPAPVVGLGLIALWNHGLGSSVFQSLAIVLLAWLARFLPIAVFLAQAALARVPGELESAAALAGAGPLRRLVSVVLPGAAPGLVAAWLAIYVLSATEFGATALVAPAGQPLLAPSVVNLMRRGQDPEIAACQVLLLAVVALPVVIAAVAMAGGLLMQNVWNKFDE